MHLDLTGRILGSGPGDVSPDLPALRRQQALAPQSEVGLSIGRQLLVHKIEGQAVALSSLAGSDPVQEEMSRFVAALAGADDLRGVEAQAATAFWRAVALVPVGFVARDETNVPLSWASVGRRASAVTGNSRGASTPAHAVWNFAYSLAAAEVEIALRGVGLDPGVSPTGLHADTSNRSAATWDVVEAVRGDVDRLVLGMIQGRRFRRRDFVAQADGRVRLTAPLARELAEAVMPVSRQAVAPIAEWLARTLANAATGSPSQIRSIPTNLTGEKRSSGRDGIRNGARKKPSTSTRAGRLLIPSACHACGVVFEGASRDRDLCDECLLDRRRQQAVAFNAAGQAAMRRRAQSVDDPSHSRQARAKLGKANSRRIQQAQAWDQAHPERPDPETFTKEILPAIQALTLTQLERASGLSNAYVSSIRLGKVVPHPMHWEGLRSAARETRQTRARGASASPPSRLD